jgi:hypothetical protein
MERKNIIIVQKSGIKRKWNPIPAPSRSMWISQCLFPTCCVTEHPTYVVSAQRIRGRVYMHPFDFIFNFVKAWPRKAEQRYVWAGCVCSAYRYYILLYHVIYLFIYSCIAVHLTSQNLPNINKIRCLFISATFTKMVSGGHIFF